MHKFELIIGTCLIGIGIGPVSWVLLVGKLPPSTTFGPAGLTGHDESSGSREVTQFMQFWFLISFFLVGIGAWFVIAGLKSRAIVSRAKPN